MHGVEERAVALLRLLFHAPGDLRLYWRFLEALAAEFSGDVVAVSLVETLTPAPATVIFGSGIQRASPGLLPMRPGQRKRGNAVPVGALFDVPRGFRSMVDADLSLTGRPQDTRFTLGGTVTIVEAAYRQSLIVTGGLLSLFQSKDTVVPTGPTPRRTGPPLVTLDLRILSDDSISIDTRRPLVWRAAAASAIVEMPLEPPISSSDVARQPAASAQMNSAESGSRFRQRCACGSSRASWLILTVQSPSMAARSRSCSIARQFSSGWPISQWWPYGSTTRPTRQP
jgi:hypothetical protein